MADGIDGAFEELLQRIRQIVDLLPGAEVDEVAGMIGLWQQCTNTLAEIGRRIAVVAHDSDAWAFDGFRSPVSWLALHSGLTRSAAGKLHRQAHDMRTMPAARAAALDGVLHQKHIDELTTCQRRAPDLYTDSIDQSLTDVAVDEGLEQFAVAVRAWHEHVDALEGPDGHTPEPAVRGEFTLHETLDGWHHGVVTLGPDDAAIVNAALDRRVTKMIQARRDGDPTSPP